MSAPNPQSVSISVTAATVATGSIDNVLNMSGLVVIHTSGTAPISFVVGDHGATPSDPTVLGADTWTLLPGTYRSIPLRVSGLAANTLVVKGISSANASFTVEVID